MKTILKIMLVVCLFVYGCTNILKLANKKNTKTVEPNTEVSIGDNKVINLNINDKNKHKINSQVLGVNTGFTFKNDAPSEADFLYFYNKLNPRVVRFPGGTIGNYYHPNRYGYGFSQKIVLTSKTFSPLSKLQIEKKPDILHAFIALCKQNNAAAIFVANIYEGNPEEMIYVIQQLINNNISVLGVEMGNELNLLSHKDEYPNVETYINKCKPFVDALRKFYPKIPIGGIVEGPFTATEIKTIRGKFFHDWNLGVAKSNLFDAFVLHSYRSCKECLKINNFDVVFEESNKVQIDFLNTYFNNTYSYFNNLKSINDKKLWMTECNVGKWQLFENTQFQANYEMKFFIQLIKNNAINNNYINIVNWHLLGLNGLIFQSKGKIAAREYKGEYMTSSEYFPFYYLSSAIGENALLVESDYTNNSLVDFLVVENNGKKYILFVNSNAYDVQLNISTNWHATTIDYLYANYIYAAGGHTYFAKDYPEKLTSIQYENKNINSNTINIPRYSNGLIELK